MTLSKKSEKLLLDAIQDVCDHVDSGSSPTKAVAKVAADRQFNKNYIKLIARGYNVGATAYKRNHGQTVLDKTAEFPLADADEVIADMYPNRILATNVEKQSSTISDEYGSPVRSTGRTRLKVTMEKAAERFSLPGVTPVEPYRRDPMDDMKAACGEADRHKLRLKKARAGYARSQDDMLAALGQFADYFKVASHDRRYTYHEVAEALSSKYGKKGESISAFARSRNIGGDSTLRKRAEQEDVIGKNRMQSVDWRISPFKEAEACIAAGREVVRKRATHAAVYAEVTKKATELLRPFARFEATASKESKTVIGTTKSAGFFSGMLGGGLGGGLSRGVAQAVANPAGNQVDDLVAALDDPEHDDELAAIRAKTMLRDLIANDEVISEFDPEEVYSAYNDISATMPRGSSQPGLARALLRKQLTQGALEPFEAQQMADIEKTVSQTGEPRKDTVSKISKVLGNSVLTGQ